MLPICRNRRSLDWSQISPGAVIHLLGSSHCREFVVTSDKSLDPVTGHEGWQVMEMGDPLTPGVDKPFTGVVLTLVQYAMGQWHEPAP